MSVFFFSKHLKPFFHLFGSNSVFRHGSSKPRYRKCLKWELTSHKEYEEEGKNRNQTPELKKSRELQTKKDKGAEAEPKESEK